MKTRARWGSWWILCAVGACAVPDGERQRGEGTVITNVQILDGTGADARAGSVRLEGDRIVEVGEVVAGPADALVDGSGLVLAPGFIDTHSHADGDLMERRDAVAALNQGITTVVVGQDGGSHFPLADFRAGVIETPPAVNVASFVGHGTLRREVLGDSFRRAATKEEIEAMGALLERELETGALGLATGLEYDPGIYSETEEVIALAEVAAARAGRYISHIRSEDRYFWDAIEEIITIGKETGIPVQISHTKLAMQSLWGQADRLLARLDEARAEGVAITADIYPYAYWQSTLTVLFPERDFEDRKQAELAVTEITSPEGMLIPRYAPEPDYEGKTLAEIAAQRGTDAATALMDLIRDAEAMRAAGAERVESVIATSMDEADIEALMGWEHMNMCTDGALHGAHPRGYGSFARVLGHYVRERGAMSLPDAIRKMTSLPAEHMGFSDRGRIEVGMNADLVLFNPDTVIDRATPLEPHALSNGIEKVWVNGELVFAEGRATGRYPGRWLSRRPLAAASLPSGGRFSNDFAAASLPSGGRFFK